MMAVTETKAMIRGGATEPFNGTWIFVEGDRIVGRVESCCMFCSWMLGHPQWPKADMGMIYYLETIMERGKCSRLYWAERGRERT